MGVAKKCEVDDLIEICICDFFLANKKGHGLTSTLLSQQKLGISIALQVILLPTKKKIPMNTWYKKQIAREYKFFYQNKIVLWLLER